MDSSSDSQNACSSSSRKTKADDEESMNVIPSKRTQFYQTYRHQIFAFPDSIMHYIAKKPPSPEMYAKMVQTCKYFFIRNPILVVSQLSYWNGWKATYNGKRTFNQIVLDKITSKLWINDHLTVNHQTANLASTILSKIYQCHAKILTLSHQHLSYNELIALGSKVERVDFYQVIVKHQDGSKKYKIQKNTCTDFKLYFSDSISAAYRTRLEEIIDEIIGTKNHNYKPPFIRFPGLDFTKVFLLHFLFC